ncbi:MAG: AMP-binding protein [Pseudomonadales bacterium]
MFSISNLYLLSPGWLQSSLLTLYGWYQYRSRFGKNFRKQIEVLQNFSSMTREEIREYQCRQLSLLVMSAYESSQYCREVLEEAGVEPEDINLENFSKIFPILEKSTILENPQRFICGGENRYNTKTLFTSGSTGAPLSVIASNSAREKNYAFYEEILRKRGLGYRSRSVTFAGRAVVHQNSMRRFWGVDYFNQTMYCSSFHISERNMPAYISAIERWSPTFIDSYPSAVYELANYIAENSVSHTIRPKFILTSSENLSDLQKNTIEGVFQCPVIDQYGCTEMSVWAVRDSVKYKANPLYAITELLPVDRENEEGIFEVVSTGLLNDAMPLFRYRLGDCVEIFPEKACEECQNVSFDHVLGRQDDMIVTPEGKRVGRLDPIFKGLEGIKEAQIIQHEIDYLEVLIVPQEKDRNERIDLRLLEDNLKARTSNAMRVSFIFTNTIPRSSRGKFRSVISRLSVEH